MKFIKLCWRLWNLRDSRLWTAADSAVRMVMADRALAEATKVEPMLRFCPRCGQRPDGDRRMEETRELVMSVLKDAEVSRNEVDFALAYYWWVRL